MINTRLKNETHMNDEQIDHYRHNREIAYEGQLGQQRRDFCINYTLTKQDLLKECLKIQSEVAASESEATTCRKGCFHCCKVFIHASIQEAESIVYYLYQNEELFDYFIKTFPAWISKLKAANDLLSEQPNNTPANDKSNKEGYQRQTENTSTFAKQDIYCPFLRDGACSIYDVRPFVCAGYFSTTPGEWCDHLHPDYSKRKVYQVFSNEFLKQNLSFYNGNLERPIWSYMPIMVNDILQYGTEGIYNIVGL